MELYLAIGTVLVVAGLGWLVIWLSRRDAVKAETIRELRNDTAVKNKQLAEAAKPLPDSVTIARRMRDGKL